MSAEKRRAGRAIRKARREQARRAPAVARVFSRVDWRAAQDALAEFAQVMSEAAGKMRALAAVTHEHEDGGE